MTTDAKYSLCNSESLREIIQMILCKSLKTFSQHFAQFLRSTSNFKHYEKKMTLVAFVFSKLHILKGTVTQMFEEHRVIAPFYGQHVERSKTLVRCHESTFIKLLCHSGENWLGKPPPYWYLSSYESVLKHWLTIRCIVFLIFWICRYFIKCSYLKN